jgi:hypothetical protein
MNKSSEQCEKNANVQSPVDRTDLSSMQAFCNSSDRLNDFETCCEDIHETNDQCTVNTCFGGNKPTSNQFPVFENIVRDDKNETDCENYDTATDVTGLVGEPGLFKVYGTVNNTWSSMLLDSGSEISLINKKLFDKLLRPAQLKSNIIVSYTGIDNVLHKSLGAVDVCIKLENFL